MTITWYRTPSMYSELPSLELELNCLRNLVQVAPSVHVRYLQNIYNKIGNKLNVYILVLDLEIIIYLTTDVIPICQNLPRSTMMMVVVRYFEVV